MIRRGVAANVGVVRPVCEASAIAVEKVNHWELLAGNELGGKIDAVGHVAIESCGMEDHIALCDAGKLAGMVEQGPRGGMAAGENKRGDGEDGQRSAWNANYFHRESDSISTFIRCGQVHWRDTNTQEG